MAAEPGTRLGRYEIRSKLGAGGMGEVYLAEDTRLHRKVALKILPAELAANQERIRRFTQEATSAAALNHPNIAHIYEIGEDHGTNFIAMEFIDGVTLREKIHRDKAPLAKLLKYLTQVAEGLSKAHSAGIVHRDLKPDNIMITGDDYAKILDFGLAKLVEPQRTFDSSDPGSSEVATAVLPQHSIPGTVMGTPGYMSPEQATGRVKEIDHRSDIFSFGCILFEAATGQKAFAGKDVLDSLHKIVHAPTPQLKDTNALAPDELQRIVRRCLAKEPDKRYQSIKEVAIELEELQLELKSASELEYTAEPTSSHSAAALGAVQTGSAQSSASGPVSLATVRSTSSAEYLFGEIKRHKRGVLLALAALIVLIAGVGFGLYKWIGQRQPAAALKITRLTFTGKAREAAISPEGKYVAYVLAEGGQQSLWLSQVAVSSHNQIVPPAEVVYRNLTFSPDGQFIYYVQTGPNNQTGFYQIPFTGGVARKLREDVQSPISFSPDGKQFVFLRGSIANNAQVELVIASVEGSEEKVLATRIFPDTFDTSGPAWSPDGGIIACGANYRSSGRYSTVIGVRIADGAEQSITAQRWNGSVGQVAWLSDGSGLVVTAIMEAGDASQIWLLSYPGNEARKITSDLNSYGEHLSLTAASGTLVAVQSESAFNLWMAPGGDARAARQITSGSGRDDGHFGLDWTPDGKVVYQSLAGGSVNMWMISAEGTGNQPLQAGAPPNTEPVVSPDGRYLIWASRRADKRNIWRMNLDGGNQKRLTNGNNEGNPQVSLDGKWVIYSGFNSELTVYYRLWKVPIDGGEPVQLTDQTTQYPAISPDGKLIACRYQERGAPSKIALIPFEGGSPVNLFDYPDPGPPTLVRWTPDGRAIAYIRTIGGVSNIWVQPIHGGPPKQLTDFKEQRLLNFAWSRDGKQLALSRGVTNSDVVLISNLK